MSTVNVATSYITDKVYVNKIGGMITEEEKIGFTGTKTVAKLKGGRTYNFATKVENTEGSYQYKAVFITKGNGNILSREFVADGKEQSFSITLGEDEHTIYINNSEGVKVVVSYEQEADFDPKPADFKTPQPFRFWCQTVLPLVYDDSLSYYELLSKVVNYLNSLINDVTNVENIYVNLINAYSELEAYVNTYFDNLDVSEAIDAKLDAMALAGDFDALVQEALNQINYTQIINTEVDNKLPLVVDEKLGTEVASQIGGVVENQIGGVVENQIGGVVESQIDAVVEEQIGDVVEAQLDDIVEEKLPDEVREQITTPVTNWLARNFEEPPVDKSLSIDNAAADAKVTGKMLDYLRDIEIEGFDRREIILSITSRTESAVFKFGNNLALSSGSNLFNCAFAENLVGGARYKISLNCDTSSISGWENLTAGFVCRDFSSIPEITGTIQTTIIGTLEEYIGQYPNGDFYIDLPYNANAIAWNSLNDTLCNLILVSMEFEGESLPDVDASDNGKVLGVVEGEWGVMNAPSGSLPVVSTDDFGKSLAVIGGEWDKSVNVIDLENNVDALNDEMLTFTAKSVQINTNKRCLGFDGLYTVDTTYLTKHYPITAGKVYKIVSDFRFQFQADNSIPTSGSTPRIGNTYASGTYIIKAPVGATYLMVCTYTSGGSPAVYEGSNKLASGIASVDEKATLADPIPPKVNTLIKNSELYTNMRSGTVTEYRVGADRDYTTINDALDQWVLDNKPAAVVYVDNGEYNEVVYVEDSTISFIGESREGTIIRTTTGLYNDAPFRIHHGNVFIANFTVIADHSDTPSMVLDSDTLYGYAFHIDGGSIGGLVHVKNCTAISYQAPAFGMGTIPGATIRIEDVDAYCFTPISATKTANNDCILCHLADPSLYPAVDDESLELINVKAFTKETPFVMILKASGSTKHLNLTAINTILFNESDPRPNMLVSGSSVATVDELSIGNNANVLNYSI